MIRRPAPLQHFEMNQSSSGEQRGFHGRGQSYTFAVINHLPQDMSARSHTYTHGNSTHTHTQQPRDLDIMKQFSVSFLQKIPPNCLKLPFILMQTHLFFFSIDNVAVNNLPFNTEVQPFPWRSSEGHLKRGQRLSMSILSVISDMWFSTCACSKCV